MIWPRVFFRVCPSYCLPCSAMALMKKVVFGGGGIIGLAARLIFLVGLLPFGCRDVKCLLSVEEAIDRTEKSLTILSIV